MATFIFVLLGALNSAILAHAGITITDWHFWVIICCMCGGYFCGVSEDL